jgi:hypothetical protein
MTVLYRKLIELNERNIHFVPQIKGILNFLQVTTVHQLNVVETWSTNTYLHITF